MNCDIRGIYGVILAAGAGARLRPLSVNLPKPLFPICNKPIIQHQIEYMRAIGIKQFKIVVGHLGRHIMEQFGNGSDLGVQIRYVIQEKPLGIAHAVYQLEDELDGPFLLFLGDIFLVPMNLDRIIEIFRNKNASGVLAVMKETRADFIRRNFAVALNEEDRVIKVIEKPRYVKDTLKGCGIYLFDLPIFDAIRRTPRTAMRDEYEITTAIQILVDDGYPVYPAEVVDWDMNVTVPCDLLECNIRLLKHMGLEYLIGENSYIPANTEINSAVIGNNVIIQNPIKIRNALIMPNTTLETFQDLENVIVTSDNIIHCPIFKP
ncbi:NTP transferase domain-containing protein [bacterium]|nr:NTP transferase domain-containing protein [candidate division CSSED10-310 bacterium]